MKTSKEFKDKITKVYKTNTDLNIIRQKLMNIFKQLKEEGDTLEKRNNQQKSHRMKEIGQECQFLFKITWIDKDYVRGLQYVLRKLEKLNSEYSQKMLHNLEDEDEVICQRPRKSLIKKKLFDSAIIMNRNENYNTSNENAKYSYSNIIKFLN